MTAVHNADDSFFIIDVSESHADLGHEALGLLTVPGQLFPLGDGWLTPGARMLLDQYQIAPMTLLVRHATGDYGDLEDFDIGVNQQAIIRGERILSSYEFSSTDALWIITEAGRHETTLLDKDEY